jgi:predicted outer membrane repeat protein
MTQPVTSLTITDSILDSNKARDGGGAYVQATNVQIDRTIVRGNQALGGPGGGLALLATATLTGDTFDANQASEHGGGVYASGTVTITGSSFTNNVAGTAPVRLDQAVDGGAISNNNALVLDTTTLTGNRSAYQNASFSVTPGAGGLLMFGSGATTTLRNVTFDNANAECKWYPGVGTLVKQGTNSFPPGDTSC